MKGRLKIRAKYWHKKPYTPPPFLNKNGSTGTDYNFNVKPFGDMFSTQYNQI